MNSEIRKAASLRYNQEKDNAPLVSAVGKGLVAEEIIKLAEEHDIPIVEDATLSELLAQLNVNEYIPVELYEVVAEVFAFIYQTDNNFKSKN